MSTEITVFDNGPCRVQGEFVIKDGKGNAYDLEGKDAVALCRCGQSENKPFCDGSHAKTGFSSECAAS